MKAGFGVASITPEPPVFLAGFGDRSEPAQTVHDDLEARALYLDDGETQLCLVVCDLLGMTAAYSYPVREAIREELEVPMDCVLISCTHTHNGPSAMAGSERLGWHIPDGLEAVLRNGCVRAALEARDAAEDANLLFAGIDIDDAFAFNRRGLPYKGPDARVLFVERSDGTRIGAIANLEIHPVLLGPRWLQVSSDWVGPFRAELGRILGGEIIELTGALGDINPTPPKGKPGEAYAPWATWDDTVGYAEALARAVADAQHVSPWQVTGPLRVLRSESKDIPVGQTGLAMLLGETSLRVEFIEWAIGGVRLVSVPGEAFTALGDEIRQARHEPTLIAGLSPTWNGYLPRPWGEGYEEGVSFGEPFVAAIADVLIDAP